MDALPSLTAPSLAGRAHTPDQARKLAEEFEASFLTVMMGTMMQNVGNDPITGGGNAGQTYRSLLTEEYAKSIANAGGVGVADQIYSELIKIQEAHS